MIAAILMSLLKANLAAAAPVVGVIALRKWARGRLGARAAYALWFAPLLAAGAVFLPHPAAPTAMALQVEAAADVFAARAAAVAPRGGPDIPALLLGVWIVGALTAIGLLAWRQARFMASLGRLTPLSERGLFRAERAGVGPAVVGVLKPKVVAPADFEARYTEDERALILAHEAAHVAGRDSLANAAACLIRCLCWFNPLAHVAARLMRVDQELACDAAVIARFPYVRRAYAELLLKTQLFTQPLPLGCHWPAGGEHPLKARIAMLSSPLPARAARRLGAAVALFACASAAGLAWASQPASKNPTRPPMITRPDWIQKPSGADFSDFYPKAALATRAPGHTTLRCAVIAAGDLTNCRVVGEDPVGQGFGDAALAMAPKFRMKPQTRDGAPVSGGEINIPIRWLPPAASRLSVP